jgi:hypothetical protein
MFNSPHRRISGFWALEVSEERFPKPVTRFASTFQVGNPEAPCLAGPLSDAAVQLLDLAQAYPDNDCRLTLTIVLSHIHPANEEEE